MPWTERQIELSRELAKLIEGKTGKKKNPEIGEWWKIKLTAKKIDKTDYVDEFILNIRLDDIARYNKRVFLHPLFTEGELLGIILSKYQKFDIEICGGIYLLDAIRTDIDHELPTVESDNLRTALLELAVRVMKG